MDMCAVQPIMGGKSDMLNQPTLDKLFQMRLSAMAQAFQLQAEDPQMSRLSFEERLGLLESPK